MADKRINIRLRPIEVQDHRFDEHRSCFHGIQARYAIDKLLWKRAQVDWTHRFARIVNLEVGEDADNLKCTRFPRQVEAESLAYRILIGKELLHKSLIDHGDQRGCGRILFRKSAAANYGYANGVEEARTHAVPRRAAGIVRSRSGMALQDNALAPVVAFQRAIKSQAHISHAGQRREAIFDLAVECGHAIDGVTGSQRIEVQRVAVGRGHAKILMFQVGK